MIPTLLIIIITPIVILCIGKLQTSDSRNEEIGTTQFKQLLPLENQFSREMEAGTLSEGIGDNDDAIACYARAALQPMSEEDRHRLFSTLTAIKKKVPSNPNVQIAFGNYFETNGQFVEAQEAYDKAALLSPIV